MIPSRHQGLAEPAATSQAARRRGRGGQWRTVALVGGSLAVFFVAGTPTARAAWQELAQFLSIQGRPEPASANVLSEHEIEALDQMTPQSQAELLLERSINHYRGANDQIASRVACWQGRIRLDDRLNGLFTTALNSGDLRVRAAAIEAGMDEESLVRLRGDDAIARLLVSLQ